MNPEFDYQRFAALEGHALVEYMDPLVNAVLNDDCIVVPREFLQRVYSGLAHYDEYHLVYALELGASRAPDLFVPLIPNYLAHQEGSVACAAVNAINRLSDDWLTPEFVAEVRRVVSSRPVRFAHHILESLRRRVENKPVSPG